MLGTVIKTSDHKYHDLNWTSRYTATMLAQATDASGSVFYFAAYSDTTNSYLPAELLRPLNPLISARPPIQPPATQSGTKLRTRTRTTDDHGDQIHWTRYLRARIGDQKNYPPFRALKDRIRCDQLSRPVPRAVSHLCRVAASRKASCPNSLQHDGANPSLTPASVRRICGH
ncbi:unnamed protein product [Calicophoron daubneyi]|uniref:Uncharacterized protein n=1 Tax=Calicophoron daubneyi TaxID=300641 RepID=A0AAV2TV79_CALDB